MSAVYEYTPREGLWKGYDPIDRAPLSGELSLIRLDQNAIDSVEYVVSCGLRIASRPLA